MVFDYSFNVDYRDVDTHNKLRIDALMSHIQEAAIMHSENVGFDINYMQNNCCGWILHKFGINIIRYPFLRDSITIKTWSNGVKGFRANRDYEFFLKDDKIGSASSEWFFIDTRKKSLKKIPEEVAKFYGVFSKSVGIELKEVEVADKDFDIVKKHVIRFSDIDTNGHLNNTVYVELLNDTLLTHFPLSSISSLNIIFKKEILREAQEICVGIHCSSEETLYKFFKDDHIYALGNLNIKTEHI